MTAALILLMRYYARAFPPDGGTLRGGRVQLVHLVHASARLVFRPAAAHLRSGHLWPGAAVRAVDHARAHLSGRLPHLAVLCQWRAVLAVRRFLPGPGGAARQLLGGVVWTLRVPLAVQTVPAAAAQAISK